MAWEREIFLWDKNGDKIMGMGWENLENGLRDRKIHADGVQMGTIYSIVTL